MAVNYVDGLMFGAVVAYPVISTKAAASAGAGWLSAVFIPLGLAAGIAVCFVTRKMIYAMMDCGLKNSDKLKNWLQYLVMTPIFLLYLVLPPLITGAGFYTTWHGTIWFVRNILE